jgi:Ca-activated chloride channel family protein
VSLLFFDDKVYPPIGPFELGQHRDELVSRVGSTIASGGTALYDATLQARELIGGASSGGDRIAAVLVMTDGKDESSKKTVGDIESAVRVEGNQPAVRVFTIAYGNQAEASILSRIAEAGQGSTAKGDTTSIVEIYKDMASFF